MATSARQTTNARKSNVERRRSIEAILAAVPDMMFRMASAISQNPDKEFEVKPPPLEVTYGE